MRWDAVTQAVAARAAGDTVLQDVYGDAIRANGMSDFTVPSLEYQLVADTLGELWHPHTLQWDQWVPNRTELERSERALVRLFDHETPQLIEGVFMWSFYLDGADLTGPAREGYHGRAIRFRFDPIRARLLAGRS